MSYIEKEPLLEKAKSLQGNLFGAVAIVREIEKADGIDIVFCKECKYSDKGVCTHIENITHSYDCDDNVYDHYIYVSPEHFCSYGVRGDNNAKCTESI